MKIPLYQVDAFAQRPFEGNPAAICPLKEWLPDATMQAIAMENNLAETAYFVGSNGNYGLRWFTPAVEVDLCGHATLASASVIFGDIEPDATELRFATKSGELVVRRLDGKLAMDFPSRPPGPCTPDASLVAGLGAKPAEILAARDYLCVFDSEDDVRNLRPDMTLLSKIDRFAVIATAKGGNRDFVSRFFAPAKGVPEDPVTGSAHCTLTPYWAKRLGKSSLLARQISPRGGDVWCQLAGDRVILSGYVVRVIEGTIDIG